LFRAKLGQVLKRTKIVNEKDVKTLIKLDKTFAVILKMYGVPPNWSRPEGFVSLSQIILEQQVSLTSAKAHFIKLNSYIGEFVPQNILKLDDDEMRMCQISRQKAKYLRELSHTIINKQLDFETLARSDAIDVRTQLIKIKGIGHWTTDIYLMFCLQSKDIFPIGDIAVVNTIKELYKVKTPDQILRLSKKWEPLRSLATYFFWHYYLSKRRRVA
jgi:DNA-3-methyladenine glycosylase II